MILEFILIASTFQQEKSISKTVLIQTDANKPAIIMQKDEAEILYSKLVKHNTDEKLFAALVIALGKIPDTVYCSLYKLCIPVEMIKQHCKD